MNKRKSQFCSQCGQDIKAAPCGPTHAALLAQAYPELVPHRFQADSRDDCQICGNDVDHAIHDSADLPAGLRKQES